MPTKTYYQVLNVAPSADLDTIKQAYRGLIRVHHPDQYEFKRSTLARSGDSAELVKLINEIERAKQTTQRINEAYATLSDAEARQRYDRKLASERAQMPRETAMRRREQNGDIGRRTVKERPHRPPQNPKSEAIPWLLMTGFIVLFLFSLNAVNRIIAPSGYVPSQPTAQGVITSNDLQATTNAEQATLIARMEAVHRPTITPRAPADNARTAQSLYEMGSYLHALELYNRAILALPQQADLYYQRGIVFVALFLAGDMTSASMAIADFDEALRLDRTLVETYRERGLLYFALWQSDAESDYAGLARVDLQTYQEYDAIDEVVLDALRQLGE